MARRNADQLQNHSTIHSASKRSGNQAADGTFDSAVQKRGASEKSIDEQIASQFGGIKDMGGLPDALL